MYDIMYDLANAFSGEKFGELLRVDADSWNKDMYLLLTGRSKQEVGVVA